MYRVIKEFHDLEDCVTVKGGSICHHYAVGDAYPREGLEPSPERISELASRFNRQGTPLIEKVGGVNLEGMTKAELIDYGTTKGYLIDPKAKKTEIIEFLQSNIV